MTKLRELLSDESKWTQTAFARDRRGRVVPLSSPEACQFCLVGGLDKLDISWDEWIAKHDKITAYISELPNAERFVGRSVTSNRPNTEYSVSKFNDFNSWETIDAMLDKLDV